jgi:small subunit ribosomal protein S17
MRDRKRKLQGIVKSDKMDKTIVVQVARIKQDDMLNKHFTAFKKFKAHDEKGTAGEGDLVEIVESRPYSKTTRFKLVRVIKKSEEIARGL